MNVYYSGKELIYIAHFLIEFRRPYSFINDLMYMKARFMYMNKIYLDYI